MQLFDQFFTSNGQKKQKKTTQRVVKGKVRRL